MSLVFTPDGSYDFYDGCAVPITELPTDPTNATVLTLDDDDYAVVTLSGVQVSLYGTSYSQFYVGSNGYITFNSGDTDTGESLDDHFEQPRISGLFDDLDPETVGSVRWQQEADHVAVTYLGRAALQH